MSKTNLSAKFYRARLFEGNRSRFVWEFGTFFDLIRFYNSVKDRQVKRDDAHLAFYLCYVSGEEIELEKFNISHNDEIFDTYDHPKRVVKPLL